MYGTDHSATSRPASPGEKPTRVLLLRHAETAAPYLFHGAESDIGLSERGRQQAEAIGPILAAERPVVVVSSAMRRAIETAEPIARACGVELLIEPDLHERRIGTLCGMLYDDREGLWAQTIERWQAGETDFATDGAESLDGIRDRVLPIWHRLAHRFDGQTSLFVGHGTVIKALLLSLDPECAAWSGFRCPNLSVSELVHVRGIWSLAGTRLTNLLIK